MNNEYKKGFLEAIDGVLGIIKLEGISAEEEDGEETEGSFLYELQNIENKVLRLKISFFEDYYENDEQDDEIKKIELPKEARWIGDDIEECINHVKEKKDNTIDDEIELEIDKKQPDATLENSVEMARGW